MIIGIAELVLFGLLADWLIRKIKLPGLIGLLILGLFFGPYSLNILNNEIQLVSHDLRIFALIVILLRAGLEISRKTLEKVGMRAMLMSFLPCLFEVGFVTIFAHILLKLSYLESAMLGSILGAVSPAVVVPIMISFIEEGRGAERGAPTLVLAGSSCDDAVAIVLATSFIGMYVGNSVNLIRNIASIPIAIITGITTGLAFGLALFFMFKKFKPQATKKCLIVLGVSIFLLALQEQIEHIIPFAALLSIMTIGFIILAKNEHYAHEISKKLSKVWIFAQLLLFTLVGAGVNIPVAINAGLAGVLVILTGLLGRSIGVQICLIKSSFTLKERVFIGMAYLPKATVQAAIGGAPLAAMVAAGINKQPGEIILAVAVLSILITAPTGAILLSTVGRNLLPAPQNKTIPLK